MGRARGAQVGMVSSEEESVEAPIEHETIPASSVTIGDMIVFDQNPVATEVMSISEEEGICRITSDLQTWTVRSDHEVNRLIIEDSR